MLFTHRMSRFSSLACCVVEGGTGVRVGDREIYKYHPTLVSGAIAEEGHRIVSSPCCWNGHVSTIVMRDFGFREGIMPRRGGVLGFG